MTDEGLRRIYNAINLICCTTLAIVFDRWWLIFLTILFWIFKE